MIYSYLVDSDNSLKQLITVGDNPIDIGDLRGNAGIDDSQIRKGIVLVGYSFYVRVKIRI